MFGDEGDDKIWFVNPEQKGLETAIGISLSTAVGGYGNDHIFGSDIANLILGDKGIADLGATDGTHLQYGATPSELADYYN